MSSVKTTLDGGQRTVLIKTAVTGAQAVRAQLETFRGADGASATITLTREADGVVITKTDAAGTQQEKVYDGAGLTDERIAEAVGRYMLENPIDPGVQFETDETLKLEDGFLRVNTAEDVEKDNTLPVTSAAVYNEVGNINALLATI